MTQISCLSLGVMKEESPVHNAGLFCFTLTFNNHIVENQVSEGGIFTEFIA